MTRQQFCIGCAPLIMVRWLDAHQDNSWTDINSYTPVLSDNCSVGWLIFEDDKCLCLVPHQGLENQSARLPPQGTGSVTIPKAMVLRKWKLKDPRGR